MTDTPNQDERPRDIPKMQFALRHFKEFSIAATRARAALVNLKDAAEDTPIHDSTYRPPTRRAGHVPGRFKQRKRQSR